ncbi:hypothetical protein N5079_22775 [Planotetraspora sp. A-T 1434]|uniref:hypothetical protein n=1 Tax=Planotetraspora sp. A-T 1434 TaxID=2979219 RepID=UPI0021BE1B4C|nr:hypothetical protein [Planotetraspora sp. A-T 1434]MCT9933037.1 hypothetical protein [Planotetraspora sp. A-T 1434]
MAGVGADEPGAAQASMSRAVSAAFRMSPRAAASRASMRRPGQVTSPPSGTGRCSRSPSSTGSPANMAEANDILTGLSGRGVLFGLGGSVYD